ncbi:NAD-binding protein [Pyxidicoccus parkwayensis]|uniref:NAD-binding protein n=1 Tax=Pyxidicoccus parkwayensis TaxID=2813578 RepID=A0ABX7NZ48_9BACT|nr:NAD-binding protein [Pyxidicoccus parkwaysis]QSQ23634.1 NAD-binding protein [Pyxidicoccus parkwaysis]
MKLSRRQAQVNLRYLRALIRRFRITLVLSAALFLLGPLFYCFRYVGPDGTGITFGEGLHHVYFLMYGQPSLPYVRDWLIELVNVVIPPVGIALVADGVVRFAYLFFARHKNDKEWIEVVTETMKGHVVVCGAGRVGYRVVAQLREMGRDVVVVEKREDAAFVSALRDEQVPLLIDDTRSPLCLPRTNVKHASAIVCATDDDLANLNIALDARRLNPDIRVVIRLFDDDLSGKVRDTFKAEALSSSSLAAPAMALAAMDPRIIHSFHLGKHLMVVSQFDAREGLPGLNIASVRDRFGALTLSLVRGGEEKLNPPGDEVIHAGDVVTFQASYPEYRRLRAFTCESEPPTWSHQPATDVPPGQRKAG